MFRFPKKLIAFSTVEVPSAATWGITIQSPVPRDRIPDILTFLEVYALDRLGGYHYYPGYPEGGNTCRFEWYVRDRRERFGLRIAVIVLVYGDARPVHWQACADVADNLLRPVKDRVPLSQRQIEKAKAASLAAIDWALGMSADPSLWRPYWVCHHVCLTGVADVGFSEIWRSPCETVAIYPTRITNTDNSRSTPVVIRVRSASPSLARDMAAPEMNKVTNLLSLVAGSAISNAKIRWGRSRPEDVTDRQPSIDWGALYPQVSKFRPSFTFESRWRDGVSQAWDALTQIDARPDLAPRWRKALLSFRTAEGIWSQSPSVASVGYCAALGALSRDLQQYCDGGVSCELCGNLRDFHHHLVGDAEALCQLVKGCLEPSDADWSDLRKRLKRVYREQRSAFVHAGEMHHGEDGTRGGVRFGTVVPDRSSPVDREARYFEDVSVLRSATRNVMLVLLGELLGDRQLFRYLIRDASSGFLPRPPKITSGRMTVPRDRTLQMIMGRDQEDGQ